MAYIAIELSEFETHFKPGPAIEEQMLSDFLSNGIGEEESVQAVLTVALEESF